MSIGDGVDLEAYARALAQVIQEVRGENQDLETRLNERTRELREAQEESARAQERLAIIQDEQAKGDPVAVLGNLTAAASHDLRNPLVALRAALYFIQNKTKDLDLGLDHSLERADRSIDRCDEIITQMLDLSRSSPLKAEDAAIDQWLDGVLGKRELPDGITVIRESGAPDVVIAFESERLGRAVINVFENGCQAIVESMKEGDTSKQHSITVATRIAGDRFELCFTDTGMGMTAKALNRIFEPLYSTKSYGTGLGMPSVRRTMELHGGGIDVESTPGEGATVILWLPTKRAKSAERAA